MARQQKAIWLHWPFKECLIWRRVESRNLCDDQMQEAWWRRTTQQCRTGQSWRKKTSCWVASVCVWVWICVCVCVDREDTSLPPWNSPKTTREQDNDLLALAKMLRLPVSHWAESQTSVNRHRHLAAPGEGPGCDFCLIQRWRSVSCSGTEISDASFKGKMLKMFPPHGHISGPYLQTGMTSSMLSNHRAPDQLSTHVEYVKQGRGTWCIWLRASDWPLPPLCGEMKSVSRGLSSRLRGSFSPFLWSEKMQPDQHITHIHIHKVGYVSHLFAIDQHLLWRGSQMHRDLMFRQLRGAPEEPGVHISDGDIPGITIVRHFLFVVPPFLQLGISYVSQNALQHTPENKHQHVAFSFMNTEATVIVIMEWQLIERKWEWKHFLPHSFTLVCRSSCRCRGLSLCLHFAQNMSKTTSK